MKGVKSPPRVVVIGGGITGLATAYRLVELTREKSFPLEVRLIEASSRLGGVIKTEWRDGFVLEGGPDSFLSEKPWALDLCKRLGLDGRLIGTNEANRRSFVVRKSKLYPVPEGFYLIGPSRFWPLVTTSIFSWLGKIRMSMDLFIPSKSDDQDESLASFVKRRLGKEALERMAQPMVASIYTADPKRLSLRATMPRFLDMERQYGSIIRALMAQRRRQAQYTGGVSGARYGLFVSLEGGMQVLVKNLVAVLPEGSVILNAPATRIRLRSSLHGQPNVIGGQNESLWEIEYGKGKDMRMTADAVCVAVPAPQAAVLLEETDPPLSQTLREIPYEFSATVNLVYARDEVPHPLNGFGFVVPAVEKRSILACTFSSVKFPGRAPEGKVLLRAFLGGAFHPQVREWNDERIQLAVREDLRLLLGVNAAPSLVFISRYPASMPQYHLGHLDRVDRIKQRLGQIKGLALAGNAYLGIGIPDCIHSGEQAADSLLEWLLPRP